MELEPTNRLVLFLFGGFPPFSPNHCLHSPLSGLVYDPSDCILFSQRLERLSELLDNLILDEEDVFPSDDR